MLIKIALIFCTLTIASSFLYQYSEIKFKNIDYFNNHGWIFLFSIAFFPRLTLFISGFFINSIQFGGFLWWVGFFIAPRILISILATISYWHTNPILVIFSWLMAMGGESSEKFILSNRIKKPRRYDQGFAGKTIDAEYQIKK